MTTDVTVLVDQREERDARLEAERYTHQRRRQCPRCFGRGSIGVRENCFICVGHGKVTGAVFDRWMRVTKNGANPHAADREGWDQE